MKKLAVVLEVVGFTAFLVDVVMIIIKFLNEKALIGITSTNLQNMFKIGFVLFWIFVACLVLTVVLRLIAIKLYAKGMDEVKGILSRYIVLGVVGIIFIVVAIYFVYYIVASESLSTLL